MSYEGKTGSSREEFAVTRQHGYRTWVVFFNVPTEWLRIEMLCATDEELHAKLSMGDFDAELIECWGKSDGVIEYEERD